MKELAALQQLVHCTVFCAGSTKIEKYSGCKIPRRVLPWAQNGAQKWDLAQITTNNLGPEHFGSKCVTQIFRKMCFVTDLASHGSKSGEN